MSPERSGHCNQGGKPGRIHCTARYEKEGRLLICKSGNLLVCRKVLHPVCSKNEMSAFCRGKDIFFIYLQKHELME